MKQKFIFEQSQLPISTHDVNTFRHKAKSDHRGFCVGCTKGVMKGEWYFTFNTILAGNNIIHVECYHYPSNIVVKTKFVSYLHQRIHLVRSCEDEYDVLRDVIEANRISKVVRKSN